MRIPWTSQTMKSSAEVKYKVFRQVYIFILCLKVTIFCGIGTKERNRTIITWPYGIDCSGNDTEIKFFLVKDAVQVLLQMVNQVNMVNLFWEIQKCLFGRGLSPQIFYLKKIYSWQW